LQVAAGESEAQSAAKAIIVPAEVKQLTKIRKRLHHEFRNMITDEWSFCRTSQANATSQIHNILISDLTANSPSPSVPQEKPVTKHHGGLRYKEDWEYLQLCGEATK